MHWCYVAPDNVRGNLLMTSGLAWPARSSTWAWHRTERVKHWSPGANHSAVHHLHCHAVAMISMPDTLHTKLMDLACSMRHSSATSCSSTVACIYALNTVHRCFFFQLATRRRSLLDRQTRGLGLSQHKLRLRSPCSPQHVCCHTLILPLACKTHGRSTMSLTMHRADAGSQLGRSVGAAFVTAGTLPQIDCAALLTVPRPCTASGRACRWVVDHDPSARRRATTGGARAAADKGRAANGLAADRADMHAWHFPRGSAGMRRERWPLCSAQALAHLQDGLAMRSNAACYLNL